MLGPVLKFVDRDYVIFNDEKLLYFGGTDYHRMSNNPMMIQALSEASLKYGLSSAASRITTGNHPIYLELEKKVSAFFKTEATAVFSSGYLSNMILLQTVAKDYSVFLLDESSHSSIFDAAKQFDKEIVFFHHLNAQALEEKLKKHLRGKARPLIMTDGVYDALGEIAPLDEYAWIVEKYEGRILIDDAHGMAVIGKTGKGSWEEKNIDQNLFFQTGTLSKGFGVFGGIIPGDSSLILNIQNHSSAFIGSTGLALPLAAAAIKSIAFLQANRQLISGLQRRSLSLKEKLRQLGFVIPMTPVPIFSISYFDEQKNKHLYQLLLDNGIYPTFANYPGSPPGGHFRFAITSNHTEEQLELLYNTIESSI
jgi:glycine C-acetyltransferase/8-amino-7-oxononanoate synthase